MIFIRRDTTKCQKKSSLEQRRTRAKSHIFPTSIEAVFGLTRGSDRATREGYSGNCIRGIRVS